MANARVGIIVASESVLGVISQAAKTLEEFGVPYEITISSAHRSPAKTLKLVEKFHKSGIKVIITGAGLAAHIAGVIAAHFPLPVIGIPIGDGPLKGMDSLLATVQMPSGIPVATVAIDGAKNAGILAVQILATSDKNLEKKIIEYKKSLAKDIDKKSDKLEKIGYQKYLEEMGKK